MKRTIVWSAALVIGSLVSASLSMAGTIYDLTASTLNPPIFSNFSITFDDKSGDDLLTDPGEIISFSGVTFIQSGTTRSSVSGVPDITGFTNGGFLDGSGNSAWEFESPTNTALSNQWSYSLTPGVAVPGPIVGAGLPGLMLAALGLLGLGRRRRQRA
jgi:hypothetical protein